MGEVKSVKFTYTYCGHPVGFTIVESESDEDGAVIFHLAASIFVITVLCIIQTILSSFVKRRHSLGVF